jgi:hypothetical protein
MNKEVYNINENKEGKNELTNYKLGKSRDDKLCDFTIEEL